jgi:hypothetical protein
VRKLQKNVFLELPMTLHKEYENFSETFDYQLNEGTNKYASHVIFLLYIGETILYPTKEVLKQI